MSLSLHQQSSTLVREIHNLLIHNLLSAYQRATNQIFNFFEDQYKSCTPDEIKVVVDATLSRLGKDVEKINHQLNLNLLEHGLVQNFTLPRSDTFRVGDQPETCRFCGTRTEIFEQDLKGEHHRCPKCKSSYWVE